MNLPKRIDITEEELKVLLTRAKKLLSKEDYEIIKGMADTIKFLSKAVGTKNVQVQKLLRLLFGTFDEKTQKVLKEKKERQDLTKETKGHGRNGADSYIGADIIEISHQCLKEKDRCPACGKGKLYIAEPGTIIRITGNAPLAAKVYELERLRCNLCGEIFTAKSPEGIGDEKYDAASGAIIALLKYGAGLPFYRLKSLQESLGIPLPASTQWEIVEHVAASIDPVYRQLVRDAAQGEILYNDDTIVKILSRMNIPDDKSNKRKGIFTSGILSVAGFVKIALFFTGHNHCGENLAGVLEKRNAVLGPPIQMCDGLSRNVPKEFKTIVSNCIVHARRHFVEINESFPKECEFVLKTLEKVYANDAYTKEKNMSPEDRLKYHQQNSTTYMEDLKVWLAAQLDEKNIEPNSALGGAISYMLKHYKAMTLFLRQPKAPLDNNLCEQILKKAILHRKNSLFYKTEYGAYVGDLFMSLIFTCNLCKVNPFEYLKALQENSSLLAGNPQKWMPWNYKDMINTAEE
ncbi:MAG: IS66 family transposase [Actinobacteria bacterium]|nr:IS66 family transposase [Actinomycetota bacterium]